MRSLVWNTKWIWFFLICIAIGCATDARVFASERILIEVFERDGCVHCQAEREFLTQLETQRDDIEVRYLDIGDEHLENLFARFTEANHFTRATPLTLIGTEVFQGFNTGDTTGKLLLQAIEKARGQERVGMNRILEEGILLNTREEGAVCDATTGMCKQAALEYFVSIPFWGMVNVYAFSLPALASVLGLIDGFNPCALWVLVTFLLVLVQMKSRERMLAVAGLFVLAESVMYYLVLNVWFTTWDFVGLDHIVTPLVGLLALAGGGFFLYGWKTSDGACKIIDTTKRASLITSIKKLAYEPLTWMSAAGIIVLAFSVNVIEFACSIGIPQAFTKILQMNQLNFWQEQGTMLLYIFFYMLDDLFIFGLALWGADRLYLTQKYSRWSTCIGGILMLILGSILIVRPEILHFF
jgi:cytochrome c biogenesis protein CcdA/glutaredoxin